MQFIFLLIEHCFIAFELFRWSRDLNPNFIWNCSVLAGAKLAKNEDPNKYVRSGCGIGFDSHSQFSLPDGDIGVSVFGVDSSSKVR